jgi:glucans biosynthesis protein
MIGTLEPEAEIQPVVSIANGEITGTVLEKIAGTDIWRLVIDISAAEGAVVELAAHLAGYDRRLTENWLYQWINAK